MSHGKTQGHSQALKKTQIMQITALLMLTLLTVSNAQPTPEAEPETTSSESSNGLVSYILTYSQSLSCEALQTKCRDLNCTSVICGVVKQLVVMQDPEGVDALSVDPALSTANQNVQVNWIMLPGTSLLQLMQALKPIHLGTLTALIKQPCL